MERRIATRLGDGSFIELTRSEIEADLVAGSEMGAKRSKAPVLGDDEIAHLLDIFAAEAKFSAVDLGDEVVLSFDGCGNAHAGTPVGGPDHLPKPPRRRLRRALAPRLFQQGREDGALVRDPAEESRRMEVQSLHEEVEAGTVRERTGVSPPLRGAALCDACPHRGGATGPQGGGRPLQVRDRKIVQ